MRLGTRLASLGQALRTFPHRRVAWGLLVGVAAAGLGLAELRSSALQARLLAATAARLTYRVDSGPSPSIRFPGGGPYDHRLGYVLLPAFTSRLEATGFEIEAQARWSPQLGHIVDAGLFPIYQEKGQAGLVVRDHLGAVLYEARHPTRAYEQFDDIPPLIVETLLFIENRELLSDGPATRSPVIEYSRLARAVTDGILGHLRPGHPTSGGSTLATQIEKLHHSPHGRTSSVAEKGRQVLSASLRAYLDGPDTTAARQRLVRDYLNALPLGAVPGHGEVIGLGDGLWAWYGAEVADVNARLRAAPRAAMGDPAANDRAHTYRQVLSLLLAANRPAAYLGADPAPLDARVDAYLSALAGAGVIAPPLANAARHVSTGRQRRVSPPAPAFSARKATDSVRAELLAGLGLTRAYDLDRIDASVHTTIDRAATEAVSEALQRLGTRRGAADAGLAADRLVARADPGSVIYSFTLYERHEGANLLRVQADTYDQPLNVSDGSRLELGSTAKLRTLASYLDLVASLHAAYAQQPVEALRTVRPHPQDRIHRWALEYLLAGATDRGLDAMLEAAMTRRYSASTAEAFFTGGGLHRFENFDAADNGRLVTVREAMRQSVNLPFIRLMQDLVRHYTYTDAYRARALDDPRSPAHQQYVARFADREGRLFLSRFHVEYRELAPADAIDRLWSKGPRTTGRLAAILRSVRPEAGLAAFAAALQAHGAAPGPPADRVRLLFEQSDPARWNWQDQGYRARVHPLELWLVGYLERHPGASLANAVAASGDVRQDAYRWLFATANARARQRAVSQVAEVEAFAALHASWQRAGYPFGALVPSYATALGSSGDNPRALSELLGIIMNDGVRYPSIRITEVQLAEGTPFETRFGRASAPGARVLPAAVAQVLRQELVGVVEHGTGRRVAGGLDLGDGRHLAIGGKTGTGDNRIQTSSAAGSSSRVVNRTAAFAFTVGDRFYGTITAFVPGRDAAAYDFTSALPVQVFKTLLPLLQPLLQDGAPAEPAG